MPVKVKAIAKGQPDVSGGGDRKHYVSPVIKISFLKLAALALMLAGSFSSCAKKNDIDMSKIDFSNIENLYEQPLPVIQKCVQGKMGSV